MPRPAPPSLEQLAQLCLGHLAEAPEQLAAFMSEAGYTPAALRAADHASPEFGLGIVDYFARNETLLLSLCANNRLDVADFMSAWAKANPTG